MNKVQKVIYHLDDDIDIHPPVALICTKHLGHVHKKFLEAENFLKAIKDAPPDLCIVDLNLTIGIGAGFSVVQAIRNKFEGKMPIIVISRRSSAKDVSIALEVGASDFLPKPIDFSLLAEKITYLLEGAEQNAFPFKKMLKPLPGKLELHFNPIMIDEVYIHLRSKFFVLRGAEIELEHELVKTIFGTDRISLSVHDCLPLETGDAYSLRMIPKKPTDEYFAKLHRYLLQVT